MAMESRLPMWSSCAAKACCNNAVTTNPPASFYSADGHWDRVDHGKHLLGRRSAVNHKHLPRDEGRVLRRQVQGHVADFFGLADASDGLIAGDLPAATFVLPKILAEIGL